MREVRVELGARSYPILSGAGASERRESHVRHRLSQKIILVDERPAPE
jgi:hypothetical protein